MENKFVLITGGSSDIAKPLIEDILELTEFKLIIAKYKNNKLVNSDRVVIIESDLSSEGGISEFLNKIEKYDISHYIQLQGNALLDDSLETLSYDEVLYSMNINLLSTNMILSKLLPKMRISSFGRITLIGTASANYGGGKNSFSYGLAKHSVEYIVKHLAKYYSEFGIISNAVSPGFIKTKFHTDVLKRDEKFLEKRGAMVRVGYTGLPKDISDLIYFITFKNKFICGEVIKADGADFI